MQFNSIIKFGSLAFDVASDEKLRELLGLVHNGAKRRGFIGVPQQGGQQQTGIPAHWPKANQPIPFAPGTHASEEKKPAEPKKEPVKAPPAPAMPNFGKWVNMDSAKKMMGYASAFNDLLNKK